MYSFKTLQSLRGIFALFVFLYHVNLFKDPGDGAVCFFMILSGFVLSAGYKTQILNRSLDFKTFLKRRIVKIYPLHLIGFVAGVLFMYSYVGRYTPIVWASNLLLIQSWIPERIFYFSCDAPSWYLSNLFFFYFLFPIFLRAKLKTKAFCSIFYLLIYFITINLLPESLYISLINVNPAFRIFDFVLGMWLWDLYEYLRNKNYVSRITQLSSAKKSIIEITVVVFYSIIIFLFRYIPEQYSLVSYWWLPMVVIIITFSCINDTIGIVSRILRMPIFLKFGELSFAFYMIHMPLIYAYNRGCQFFGIDPTFYHQIPQVAILLSVSTLVSILINRHLEPPLRAKLQQLINK